VRYPDGFTETLPSFNNVRRVQNTTSVILVGSTVERTLAINPGTLANNPSRCGRLLFGVGEQGAGLGSESVLITRVDARTWEVRKHPFLATIPGAESKELLLREEDVQVLHGFDSRASIERCLRDEQPGTWVTQCPGSRLGRFTTG